ncbi:MAG: mechanosensitive ion channel [Pseudomonadales bacterium]|jgi:potassium efflux system protein|nr:mechanosensitive ion channel [Gammaproteobacteria bacterium]MBP6050694.1 mechanosensitive ion channel [Pseudomonadales bacterium]MBK6585509.1 mechanosensitive ion channel [Gammaproteobacteria bacterium]MBK7520997.1 mechanosensitive ion channel [Gammaproteobacteria bacterium]MBK8306689.1 mechanosensitive ion channel [Gammaproteobacteria bacterium]
MSFSTTASIVNRRFADWAPTAALIVVLAFAHQCLADDTESELSLPEMQQRLASYQGASQADPQNAKLAELYAAVVANLQTAIEYRSEQERFDRLFQESAGKVERSDRELRDLQRQTRSVKSLSQSVAIARLERVLSDTRAKLEKLRVQDAKLLETMRTLQGRSEDARLELKQAVAQGAASIAPAARAEDSKALSQARRDEWRSRQLLTDSKVAKLETEIRTIPERLVAVRAQQKLVGAQRELAEQFLAELLNMDTLKRISEAEQARTLLAERMESIQSQHPEVLALKQGLMQLADERVFVVTRAESISEELNETNDRLRELKASADSIREQLTISSIDDALGPVLMEHYLKLGNYDSPESNLRRISAMLAAARLRGFEIGQLLQSEVSMHERVYRAIEATTELNGVPFSNGEREAALAASDRLLSARSALLESLNLVLVQGTEQLVDLDQAYTEQAEVAEDFRELLDRNLIWMKSHRPLNLDDLLHWPAAAWQVIRAANWRGFPMELARAARSNPLIPLLALIFFALQLRYRGVLMQRLESRSARKIGWRNYRFHMAFEAIGTHVFLALPLPVLLVTLGWLSGHAEEPDQLSTAFAIACYRTALLGYGYLVIREALGPQGFARQHLRWKAARVQSVERLLITALWVLLPLLFVNVLTTELSAKTAADQSFRIGLLLVAAAFFVFSVLVTRAARGMFNAAFFSRTHPILQRIWPLLVLAVIALQPLALVLDVLGYHFTAIALLQGGFVTIVLIMFTKMALDTGLLGITIASQRSIAAHEEERADGSDQGDSTGTKPAEAGDEINWERMNDSAVALFNVIILGGSAVLLLTIWSQFFTALQVLDTVALWNYETVVAGTDTLATVSLFDAGKALLVLVLGLVLAKGLPSLIGIVFYSFITKKGVLYAIQTVLGYLVATAGVMISLQMLGFGWSKLQWMAAGLSVGVGFGLQAIFANFFAGLIMLFERPVRIGDVITLGEFSGTIQRIRMRATTITDFDNREIIVPNQTFVTERLINWTLSSTVVRTTFEVGISYDADPRVARDTLLSILGSDPRVLKEPAPNVVFREFGASSLNLRCFFHVEDVALRFPVLNDMHMRITEVFREKGIEIAYPQMDLHLRSVDQAAQLKS